MGTAIRPTAGYTERALNYIGFANRSAIASSLRTRFANNPVLAAHELRQNNLLKCDPTVIQQEAISGDPFLKIEQNLSRFITPRKLSATNLNLPQEDMRRIFSPSYSATSPCFAQNGSVSPTTSRMKNLLYYGMGVTAAMAGANALTSDPVSSQSLFLGTLAAWMAGKKLAGTLSTDGPDFLRRRISLDSIANVAKNWGAPAALVSGTYYFYDLLNSANNQIPSLFANLDTLSVMGALSGVGWLLTNFVRNHVRDFYRSYGGQLNPGTFEGMKKMVKYAATATIAEAGYLAARVLLFASATAYAFENLANIDNGLAPWIIPLLGIGTTILMRSGGHRFSDSGTSLERPRLEGLRKHMSIYSPVYGIAGGIATAIAMSIAQTPLIGQYFGIMMGSLLYLFVSELHSEIFSMNSNVGFTKNLKASPRPVLGVEERERHLRGRVDVFKRSDTGLSESNMGMLFNTLIGCRNVVTLSLYDRPMFQPGNAANFTARKQYLHFLGSVKKSLFSIAHDNIAALMQEQRQEIERQNAGSMDDRAYLVPRYQELIASIRQLRDHIRNVVIPEIVPIILSRISPEILSHIEGIENPAGLFTSLIEAEVIEADGTIVKKDEKEILGKLQGAGLCAARGNSAMRRLARFLAVPFDSFEREYIRKNTSRITQTTKELDIAIARIEEKLARGFISSDDFQSEWSDILALYDPMSTAIIPHSRKAVRGDNIEIQKGQGVDSLNAFRGQAIYQFGEREWDNQPARTLDLVAGKYTRVQNPEFRYGACPGTLENARFLWIEACAITDASQQNKSSTSPSILTVDNTPSEASFSHSGERTVVADVNGCQIPVSNFYFATGNDPDIRPSIKRILSRSGEEIADTYTITPGTFSGIVPRGQESGIFNTLLQNGYITAEGGLTSEFGLLTNSDDLDIGTFPENMRTDIFNALNARNRFMGTMCIPAWDYYTIADKNDVVMNREDVGMLEMIRTSPDWFMKLYYDLPWSKANPQRGDKVVDANIALGLDGNVIPWQIERTILREMAENIAGLYLSYKIGDEKIPLTEVKIQRRSGQTEGVSIIYEGDVSLMYSHFAKFLIGKFGLDKIRKRGVPTSFRFNGSRTTLNSGASETTFRMITDSGTPGDQRTMRLSEDSTSSPLEGLGNFDLEVTMLDDFIIDASIRTNSGTRTLSGKSPLHERLEFTLPARSMHPKYLDILGLPSDENITVRATDFPKVEGNPWFVFRGNRFLIGRGDRTRWREQLEQ